MKLSVNLAVLAVVIFFLLMVELPVNTEGNA